VTPAIETIGLTKRFGQRVAVADLDLRVEPGEVFGFLGPNGAGKTTTIRLLLDAVRPTAGSASVLGGSGADPAVRARIGYLPGDLHLDPAATAAELLDFAEAVRGRRDPTRRAALLDRFDLDESRPVRQLSTGNRRKVGVVLALVHSPDLLVLDEPTSGLDPLLQHQFNEVVRDAVTAGATVFLSSHVLPEVEALAARVGILREGRLVRVFGIDELRSQARQQLVITAAGARLEDFADLPGVVRATGEPGTVHLEVDGSVDAVVKAAARFDVQRITSHEVDLETTFLDLYRDQP
jgi:ABC-2 type transport system ATP-binding protein